MSVNSFSGQPAIPTSYGFTAGKNKIINGDFGVWQRGTSFTATGYTADRFRAVIQNSTTVSRQTFTPGTAPVAGYEGQYYLRLARTTSANSDYLTQKIEDVRTFAGQTVTVSFWAKANASVALTSLYLEQDFGSGGSGAVSTSFNAPTITTSWARYSYSVAVPSISGKTVGTSSFLDLIWAFASGMGNCTIDIWGVQLEAGSTATPFQTTTGTKQGELAACQRYYSKSYDIGTAPATNLTGNGVHYSQQSANITTGTNHSFIKFPVNMRSAPTVTIYSYTSSTAGAVSTASTTDLAANSGIANRIGESGASIYNNSGGTINVAGNGFIFHWVASVEL